MGLLLILLLVLLCVGGLPTWGVHDYGYAPSGLLTVLLIVVVILAVTGRLHL